MNKVNTTMDQRFRELAELPISDRLSVKAQLQQLNFLTVAQAAFYLDFVTLKRFQDVASSGCLDLAITKGVHGRRFHREALDRIMIKGMKRAVNA